MDPGDDLLSECLRQLKLGKEKEPDGHSWQDKPLHGMYHRRREQVAEFKKTYQWPEKA